MLTFAKLAASLLALFNRFAAWFAREQAKQEGRDAAELEGRRNADRVSDAVERAADGVHDDLESIKADPANRRRRNPLP